MNQRLHSILVCIAEINGKIRIISYLIDKSYEKYHNWIRINSSFFMGLAPVIHKYVMKDLSFQTVMFIEAFLICIATVFFGIYYYDHIVNDIHKLNMKTFGLLLLAGILCGFVTNFIYFSLIKNNDSYIVTALTYCSPFFTLFLAYYLLQEKITYSGFVGVVLIVFGVMFISFN